MKSFLVIVAVVLATQGTTGAPQYNGQQAPGGYGTFQGPAIGSLTSSGAPSTSSATSAQSSAPAPSPAPSNLVDQSAPAPQSPSTSSGGSGSASGPAPQVTSAFQSSSSGSGSGPAPAPDQSQTASQSSGSGAPGGYTGGAGSVSGNGPSQPGGGVSTQSGNSGSGGAPTNSGNGGSTFSSSAGGAGGNNLNTNCRSQPAGDGRTKFVCDPLPDAVRTLRSEHILWLTNLDGKSQVYDIEVPNYKIEELIKAGFKGGKGGDTKINVLLKKPEQSADAQVDTPKYNAGSTSVNVQYEPTVDQKIHFPTDKQYQTLSGPLLPPGGDGGQSQPPPQGGKYNQ